jgi:dipeptidyl aminopeptidase/acylaminoacyl peptidase
MNRLFFTAALLAAFTPSFVQSAPAQAANTAPAKRPMTFEDMMNMKRLGDTAVSPDGKWLAYSVTSVDLAKNKKTAELWLQAIAGGEPKKIEGTHPGDSGLQFSADGRSVLFLSSRTGAEQIWLADFDTLTGTASNLRKLSNLDLGIDNAIWSPDGKSIVFTAEVYPDCPAIAPRDGGKGAECSFNRDAEAAASPVKAQIFTHLLYRHWDHFTGPKRSHLFLIDVASGEIRDLTPNDPRDVPPYSMSAGCGCAFSPDSKELAFTENLDPEPATSVSAKIFTLDLTDAAAKPVAVSNSNGGNFNPAYSPDGKNLAWRSEERAGYEADKFRLFVLDRARGSKSAGQQVSESAARNLLPNFDRWVDEFVWAPDSKSIYFVAGHEGASAIFNIQSSGIAADRMGLERFFTPERDSGEYSGILVLPGSNDLLASRMSVREPGEVVRFSGYVEPASNPESMVVVADFSGSKAEFNRLVNLGEPVKKTWSAITHLNDVLLAQLDLSRLDPYWFTAADGTKLQGFIVRPPAFDPAKKYPVKFLIHGGPQGAWGDMWSYRWNPELFAANGYVVVMVNPRGSTGYGQAVTDGVNGDWGGKPFSDLMLGLDAAETQFPFIDKNRECALGASYGGYMANWVLGHTDRFKCIVSHDGMFNPESAFASTEEAWFNIWEFRGHPWDYYGKPDSENPFRKFSPMMSAKNFKTPTLVIHGQLDYRLDVSEGFQLFDTLQLLKVPSKMLYFPDEGHWVLKPQNSQLWWKTVNDWVDQWTGKPGTGE